MAKDRAEVVTKKTASKDRKARNSQHEALQEMSDEDLMSQFQAGTVEAFNILVDRYSERKETGEALIARVNQPPICMPELPARNGLTPCGAYSASHRSWPPPE